MNIALYNLQKVSGNIESLIPKMFRKWFFGLDFPLGIQTLLVTLSVMMRIIECAEMCCNNAVHVLQYTAHVLKYSIYQSHYFLYLVLVLVSIFVLSWQCLFPAFCHILFEIQTLELSSLLPISCEHFLLIILVPSEIQTQMSLTLLIHCS